MNFYNFIYKSILIHFHLKKVIYTNNFLKNNFTCKKKKKTFIALFTKMLKFNPTFLIKKYLIEKRIFMKLFRKMS